MFKRLLAAASMAACLLPGCGGYPEVSPATYEVATALVGACNRQQSAALDQAEAAMNSSLAAGQLSEREAGWLKAIIATAREDRWKEAEQEARQLMRDQARSR